MSGIETRLGAEHDADKVRAAFYGFVQKHEADVDGDAHISTEFDPRGSRLRIRLWSAEAMDAFLAGLDTGGRARRRPCFE